MFATELADPLSSKLALSPFQGGRAMCWGALLRDFRGRAVNSLRRFIKGRAIGSDRLSVRIL